MRVIIYYGKLTIGGAERSTIELANGFCQAGHDVTMFLETKGGALDNNLLPGVKMMYFFHDTGALKNWNRKWTGVFSMGLRAFLDATWQYIMGCVRKAYYSIKRPKFDLGITSFNGLPAKTINKYARCEIRLKMMRSERPIVFNGVPSANVRVFEHEFASGELNGFVCVSKHLRESMIKYCRITSDHIHAIYNLKTPFNKIKHEDFLPDEYINAGECLKIVTVCRLHEPTKGLVRMADVSLDLKNKGYIFKWFVVGDGVDRNIIENAIKERGIDDCMYVCGFKKDPYSYYKYADLVAILSYVEGFCGAVTEAKLLEKPLIVTHFAVEEQIQHGVNGYIVENNTESIIKGMERLLSDETLRKSLAVNGLAPEILDNEIKIRQFEELYKVYKDIKRNEKQ
ncbi:MAG: glycosyltransferase [Bacteroidaceae bacterium]|nr:glycosyltransferase [Bacteroidaceae bacterium]